MMGLMPTLVLGAGGVTSLTQPAGETATSAAATITGPAGIQAGDLLVLLDRAVAGSLPTKVIPTDFVEIDDANNGSSARQVVSYKIADGSEASASLTGMDGSVDRKALYVFRGDKAITAVNVSTPNSEQTSGNPASQSVLASAGAAPLIVFGCYGVSSGSVDPRTFTPTKDGEINEGTNFYLAYRIDNSAGQDTTVDMDDEGDVNILQSFYIECA